MHGKAKNAPHAKVKEERTIPEIHLDFAFWGPKDSPNETVTCLVVREAVTKMTLATALQGKSPDKFVVKRVLAFLDEVGCLHQDMIVKSDQESSINSLVDEIGRMRAAEGSAGRWVKEHSLVGSSASSGIV